MAPPVGRQPTGGRRHACPGLMAMRRVLSAADAGFPGAVDAAAKKGSLSIRFGLGWAKSHSFHTGQTPVMKYNRQLMQAIMWDRIKIADIVGVEVISLDEAPRGYGEFDAGVPKKFVIDPHRMFSKG